MENFGKEGSSDSWERGRKPENTGICLENTEDKSCFCFGLKPKKTSGFKVLIELCNKMSQCQCNLRLKMKLMVGILVWHSMWQVKWRQILGEAVRKLYYDHKWYKQNCRQFLIFGGKQDSFKYFQALQTYPNNRFLNYKSLRFYLKQFSLKNCLIIIPCSTSQQCVPENNETIFFLTHACYELNAYVLSTLHSYIEILTPNAMILDGRAFGR